MSGLRTGVSAGLAVIAALAVSLRARADDGAIEAVGGTVAALRPHPAIAMTAEYVRARISPDSVSVDCIFFLTNDGPADTVTVGFPCTSGGSDVGSAVPFRSFRSFVDGAPVRVEEVADATEEAGGTYRSWWIKTVAFAAGETKSLRDEYVAVPGGTQPNLRYFEYVLQSGATWAGPIGVVDVVMTFEGIPADSIELPRAQDGVTSVSPTEFRWHLREIEPDRDSRYGLLRVFWRE